MKKLKVGVVGLGQRGYLLLKPMLQIEEAQVTAVCDAYQDRVDKAIAFVSEKYEAPKGYTSFDDFLANSGVDAVLVCTSWKEHIRMSIECMKAGIITAMEVGGAETVEECWELVDTYEKTKTPFYFLENCCYEFSARQKKRSPSECMAFVPLCVPTDRLHSHYDRVPLLMR